MNSSTGAADPIRGPAGAVLRRAGSAQGAYALVVLGAVLFCAVLLYSFVAPRVRSRCPRTRARVGCPVALTDGTDFTGNAVCLGLGSHPRARESVFSAERTRRSHCPRGYGYGSEDANSGNDGLHDIASYEVRPGYVLRAWSEPNFRGRVLIDAVGPRVFRARGEKTRIPLPGSVEVRLVPPTLPAL